ncbi:hypothetical protein PS9374_04509 [Planomonospora sphaerica]|uniref:Uncharacterized protein n=1 Tax=Planomonospora sphaerica TaxID=161355 RepID=A0A161LJ16_9ACTN|nr:hypothetical protein [Planomonospora sphaerica]GAT68844.1 hypothetical protein PS9374_04509 [Planomonospora sphaerica]
MGELSVGDIVEVVSLQGRPADTATWLLGCTGRVTWVAPRGPLVQVTIDAPPSAAGHTVALHRNGLAVRKQADVSPPRVSPQIGDPITVLSVRYSSTDIHRYEDDLVGQHGRVVQPMRGGTHALVELATEIKISGGGYTRRWVLHVDDLDVRDTASSSVPAMAPFDVLDGCGYGSGITGKDTDPQVHAIPLPATHPIAIAACQARTTPVLVGSWCIPWSALMSRACAACIAVLTDLQEGAATHRAGIDAPPQAPLEQ